MKYFVRPTPYLILCLIQCFILAPTLSYSADVPPPKTNDTVSGIEALTPDLRDLLAREMQALQTGMMAIIPAFVSGNWTEIETTAHKMKNSYILKQSLTEKQAHQLHSVLPPAFIEKDQRFHYLAGMLEQAAKHRKPELVNFYFSEMTNSCVSCHSAFAQHKFPALASGKTDHDHQP